MKGWLARVPMVHIGGHPEMDELYAVGASDPMEALTILEGQVTLTTDQIPETVTELSTGAMLRLGVSYGQVGLVQVRS